MQMRQLQGRFIRKSTRMKIQRQGQVLNLIIECQIKTFQLLEKVHSEALRASTELNIASHIACMELKA